MCSTTIEAASKSWCVNNGKQTKGNTNRIFRLASLLQVTKSASGCISNKSIGTRMTKLASGDKRKCLTGTKKSMSMETTTAQGKTVAMIGLSIKLSYPKKREHRSSLSPSLHFSSLPHPTLQREKSVLVFLFGVPALAKLDKILKY